MNREEQLQKLLRLKRYEQPEEGWAESFLEEFQRRRECRESIRESFPKSALTLWRERAGQFLETLRRPTVVWSTAAAYACFMLLVWAWPRPDHAGTGNAVTASPERGAVESTSPVRATAGNVREARDVSKPVPKEMTVTVDSQTEQIPQPLPGKSRTPDQPRDIKRLIGPPLLEPEKP